VGTEGLKGAHEGVQFVTHQQRVANREARKLAKETTALLESRISEPWIFNIFLHPLIFNFVYYCYSFWHRNGYKQYIPYAAQFGVLVVIVLVLLYGLRRAAWRRSPWFWWCVVNAIIASGAGALYGNRNYDLINYYYTFRGMATYVNINPTLDFGGSFGDAGEVYFKEGSRVDTVRGVAFKNTNLFCAAPIVLEVLDENGEVVEQAEPPESMDWWAIGVDCCSPSGEDFHCGEVGTPLARAGMRLLDNFDLPFYEFAVHQWAAKHGIPAKNPLFFTWVSDPLGKVAAQYLQAHQEYYLACTEYFIANLIAVLILRALVGMMSSVV